MTADVRHVLVVDDDELLREVAKASLELVAGWRVSTASSGAEAEQRAGAEQPDVIVLDVMMPGQDGPSTFARLQRDEQTAHIPVIFLTAKNDPSGWSASGVVGVIPKPFDAMRLASQISELLGVGRVSDRARDEVEAPAIPVDGPPTAAENEALRAIGKRARKANVVRATRLRELLEHAADGRLDEDERLEAESLAHQIVGSAGTFGFAGVSRLAVEAEHYFARPDQGEGRLDGARQAVSDLLAQLGAGVHGLGDR